MTIVDKINAIRSKLARFIIETGLPGSLAIGRFVRTKEEEAELTEHFNVIVAGMRRRWAMMDNICSAYPDLVPWLRGEKGLIFNDYEDKGTTLIEMALGVLTNDGEYIEELPRFFAEFATSPAEFEATIRHFSSHPHIYMKYGWLTEQGEATPDFQEMVNSGAVMQILEKDFAERLTKATGKPYGEMLARVQAYNNASE